MFVKYFNFGVGRGLGSGFRFEVFVLGNLGGISRILGVVLVKQEGGGSYRVWEVGIEFYFG